MLPVRRLYLSLMALLLLPMMLVGCNRQSPASVDTPASETYYIFDTVITVKVYDPDVPTKHFDEIKALLERIDREMNRQRKDSEIDRVNRQAGKGGVLVSEETYRVVRMALEYAAATDGKFDPTVGPLVDLWGIGQEEAAVPDAAELEQALMQVNYRDAALDEATLSVALARPGMSLDLGAIAKGYAADLIAEYLRGQGYHKAIIDLGGNVLAMGSRPDGSGWRIGIQDPGEQRGNPLGMLEAQDRTIVTSGIYERYFHQDGAHYHHILDTRTGYPVDNNLLSVTIVTDESMQADAMSTSVFALGLADGMKFVESREDAEAIFITKDKEVYLTSGLKDQFRLTREDYRLAREL